MDDWYVRGEEHFLRWVFDPRHIIQEELRSTFISLRPVEKGISGQIYERLDSEDEIAKSAIRFVRKKETYYGYAMAIVEDIRNIAKEKDQIDVVLTDMATAHAEIRFNIGGEDIVGNTPNPRLSYYFNVIKDLLSKNVIKY